MSDQAELIIQTKESVALSLAQDIANNESLYSSSSNYRKDMLDLYAECLIATDGYRNSDEG